MTNDKLVATLAAIKQNLDSRRDVWCTLVAPDGTIVKRIYRGSFSTGRTTQTVPPSGGRKHE